MQIYIGDGITYSAELFRIAGNTYKRLEKNGYGYISQIVNNELVYVWNGIRHVLVHRKDIIINFLVGGSYFTQIFKKNYIL